MVRLILQRVFLGCMTLLILVSAIFFATAILPGDLAQSVLGREASEEALAAFRISLGLDAPLHVRYWNWLSDVLSGDLGRSLISGVPIIDLAYARTVNTLFLAAMAALMGLPLGVAIGLIAALYRGSALDRICSTGALASVSFPDFFVAYLLIAIFAIAFPVFPSISMVNDGASFAERLYVSFLPAFSLAVFISAHTLRTTRAAVIDTLSRPYIEMADLKGLAGMRVVFFHALPNSIAPIVNVVAFNLAYVILGVVIIEVVFAYPGLGVLLVDSVSRRDVPVVQAACLFFAVTYLLINLVADLIAIISNPRLRYPR